MTSSRTADHYIKKGGLAHETPTWWGLGRVHVHSLTPANREAVSKI